MKITNKMLEAYGRDLTAGEKSSNTVGKYLRDVAAFREWNGGKAITKDTVIAYKQYLEDKGYKARSINSMLASLNSFFTFLGRDELKVKSLRVQRDIYRDENKELTRAEYRRLCAAAEKKHNERLVLILQTICGTGIRVSELRFITAEAVQRGEAVVHLKGKTRTVLLVRELQKKLLKYTRERGIRSGPVFVTKSGNPMSRSNIWREMKALCADASVDPSKVFPHNLRHLFARVFYGLDKDIAKLADILGHSSIETTRIYIMTGVEEHRRYMENMRLVT